MPDPEALHTEQRQGLSWAPVYGWLDSATTGHWSRSDIPQALVSGQGLGLGRAGPSSLLGTRLSKHQNVRTMQASRGIQVVMDEEPNTTPKVPKAAFLSRDLFARWGKRGLEASLAESNLRRHAGGTKVLEKMRSKQPARSRVQAHELPWFRSTPFMAQSW